MASPSILSQSKSQPLSYADRAKKAQNIKSSISHNTIPPVTHTNPTNIVSNGPALESSPSNPISILGEEAHPSQVSPNPTATPAPTTLPVVQTADDTDEKTTVNANRSSNDLATKALSIVAAHTGTSKTPNVWSLRMERMAARPVPRTPHTQPPASQSMPIPNQPLYPTDHPPATSQSSRAAADSGPNALLGPSAPTASKGVTSLAVPSLIDADNWPEVGKAVAPTITTSEYDSKEENGNNGANKHEAELTHSGSGTSRKSEKTKWVPIPPEELQAAADAHAKSSRSRQHSASRKTQISRSVNTSSSAIPGSALGQSQSRIQSAAQSRAHSRSGSLQSSPRFPRGRRLPGDDPVTASGYSVQTERHLGPRSRASSPLQVQPHLQPTPQPIPTVDQHQPSASLGKNSDTVVNLGAAYPMSGYSQGHLQPPANGALPLQFVHSHSPTIPQHGQPQPNYFLGLHHPPRPYHHTPSGTPPLPPPGPYPHHPHQQQHQPQHPGPFPQYAMYPPYEYHPQIAGHQPQPYGYWNGYPSQPGSGHHSPAYPPPPSHYGAPFVQPYPPPPPPHHHHQAQQQHREYRARVPPATHVDAYTNTEILPTTEGVTAEQHTPARPPPPELSQPVSGYRPAATVVPSPPSGSSESGVVFGSIGLPGASACPSPVPAVYGANRGGDSSAQEGQHFTKFSIGVSPGEVGPDRMRSRTRSQNGKGSRTTPTTGEAEHGLKEVLGDLSSGFAGVKVIDLTEAAKDAKWEFGTATTTTAAASVNGDEAHAAVQKDSAGNPVIVEPREKHAERLAPILPSITGFDSPLPTSFASTGSSPRQLEIRLQQLSVSEQLNTSAEPDPFEVKDYGYGFGSGSRGSVSPPNNTQMPEQTGEQKEGGNGAEREQEKEARYKDRRDMEVPVRPRRGGGGGAGYYATYGNERGHERGGDGRGYGRRGRGMNGFGRGYNRRGGGGGPGFHPPPHHRQPPPFNVPPPPGHFGPMVNHPMGDMANGFLPPGPSLTTYIPTGYETYVPPMPPVPATALPPAPPVPVPVSPIMFPLDATRWYLLGQLEYYLSPQNLAQDFFLRRQMDSRGWVPISLIASFNRVQRLTTDPQLVREVLALSSVVQVKDNSVRMIEWKQFVLPDAMPSAIEPEHDDHDNQQVTEHAAPETVASGDVDDEDEEEVVFVMNHEEQATTAPGSPDRHA
ncbi:hypothetical protein H0H81_012255 [Sphagnurus paluster]|uniref:HTH La-type RNA-binding domain-containing protein n=1 Tax=Sphagnurus paluster TaxID=117069 RepID=A0A9P7KNI2_9AGAR|nr:hypothetical protein H0H81_012255 [Sphagnurus paluster]